MDCTGSDGSATDEAQLTVQSSPGITVSITPSTATLTSGGSIQFSAVVTGDTSNQGVSWTASLGSPPVPSSTNPLVATYTAPNVQQNTNVQIVATSVADATASASATVTVTPGTGGSCTAYPPPQITVSPGDITIPPGSSQIFTATIVGGTLANPAVIWSLQAGIGVTDPGTITSQSADTALYQAPNSSLATAQIIATSVQCPSIVGYATVEVH